MNACYRNIPTHTKRPPSPLHPASSHSPNCTDATGGHGNDINCAGGCLFELRRDATEHSNLKAVLPDTFSALKARFDLLKASVNPKATGAREAAAVDPTGWYETQKPLGNGNPPVCQRMRDTWAGFFGPWSNATNEAREWAAAAEPSPSPPSSSRKGGQ